MDIATKRKNDSQALHRRLFLTLELLARKPKRPRREAVALELTEAVTHLRLQTPELLSEKREQAAALLANADVMVSPGEAADLLGAALDVLWSDAELTEGGGARPRKAKAKAKRMAHVHGGAE